MKESIRQFRHNQLLKFDVAMKKYNVPPNFRVSHGVDIYKVAKEELKLYFNGKLTLEELAHPDNTLRQVMLLWGIDRKKFEEDVK